MDCAEILAEMLEELKLLNTNIDELVTANTVMASDIEELKETIVGLSDGTD